MKMAIINHSATKREMAACARVLIIVIESNLT